MDRALLERMVGAVVLVLLLVVVAPWLLDGDSKQSVFETDDQNRQGIRTEVIILNAPKQVQTEPAERSEVAATVYAPPPPAPAPAPITVTAPPAKPIASSAKPAQRGNEAGFAVQLGSFGDEQNAQQYAAKLKNEGYAVFVRAVGKVHRVFAGPRPNRATAEQLADVLRVAGYKGLVVELDNG